MNNSHSQLRKEITTVAVTALALLINILNFLLGAEGIRGQIVAVVSLTVVIDGCLYYFGNRRRKIILDYMGKPHLSPFPVKWKWMLALATIIGMVLVILIPVLPHLQKPGLIQGTLTPTPVKSMDVLKPAGSLVVSSPTPYYSFIGFEIQTDKETEIIKPGGNEPKQVTVPAGSVITIRALVETNSKLTDLRFTWKDCYGSIIDWGNGVFEIKYQAAAQSNPHCIRLLIGRGETPLINASFFVIVK